MKLAGIQETDLQASRRPGDGSCAWANKCQSAFCMKAVNSTPAISGAGETRHLRLCVVSGLLQAGGFGVQELGGRFGGVDGYGEDLAVV